MQDKQKYAVFALVAGALLALGFNSLFMWRVPGLSLFIYAVMIVATLQVAGRYQRGSWQIKLVDLYYLPVLLASLVPLFAQNYLLSAVAVIFVYVVGAYVSVIKMWQLRPDSVGLPGLFIYTTAQSIAQLFYTLHPFWYSYKAIRSTGLSRVSKLLGKVLLGLVVALPLVCCFAVIFMMADQAFMTTFDITKLFENLLDPSRIWELVVLVVLFVFWVGFLASLFFFKEKVSWERTEKRYIDPIVSLIVSVSLNIVFLMFVVIQFVYLFGDESNISTLGTTFADYARRGFLELIIAVGLSYAVVFILRRYGYFYSQANNLVLQVSLLIQVLLTGVVLLSALRRLDLYRMAYNMTDFRMFVYAALLFCFIALVAMAVGVFYMPSMHWQGAFNLAVMAIILLGLALINPGAYIANYNIDNYLRAETIEVDLDKSFLVKYMSSDAYYHLLRLDEVQEDATLMCDMARAWQREWGHRDSVAEFNIYRAGIAAEMDRVLAKYYDEDGNIVDNCQGESKINSYDRWEVNN